MQAAVAVPEGWVAAVVQRLRVLLTVLGLLKLLQVQVSVQLEAQAAAVLLLLLLVVVVERKGPSVQTCLRLKGSGGDHG